MSQHLIAGVDGCRKGWVIAVGSTERPWRVSVSVVTRFAELMEKWEPQFVAVDIPIGLPERSGKGGREPDRSVRRLLVARRSSVFSVPSRRAIQATNHAEACAISRATSDPPSGVSLQIFHIFPKIREVDECLQANPNWRTILHESHPEVAFWQLNGREELKSAKKVKGKPNEIGLNLRRRLLLEAGLDGKVVHAKPPQGAREDDLLDALAMFTVADRIARGLGESFPNPPARDEKDLPMAIWT